MITDATLRLPARRLAALVRGAFEGLGISPLDAGVVAEVLIYANLRGIDSHGFNRVPTYMERVRLGVAAGTERMRVIVDAGAVCRLDAHHALGPPAASRAMTLAVERGRRHGVGLVAVGGSTHFGPAGYYARQAAEHGLIGISITNAPATMAPFGAVEPFLGTNPIAIACPVGRHGVFALDMSSSVVARGKIMRAALLGTPISAGLALDASGAATTDPQAALGGSVLPVGGPKGSNLALAITMLCAVLAGSDCDDEMASMYEDPDRPQSVGHVFIAIDPEKLESPSRWAPRLESLVDRLHALRRVDEEVEVLFAGEVEDRCAADRGALGIPVPVAEMAAFAESCSAGGLEELAGEARALVAGVAAEEGQG